MDLLDWFFSFGRFRFDVPSGRVAGRDASDDFNARGDMSDPPVLKLRSPHGAKKRTPSKQNDLNMYYDHPSEDDALYGVAGKPYSTPVNPPSGRANDDRAMTTNRGYTRWNPVDARRSPLNPDRQPFNDDYNTRDKYNHSPDKDKFKNFDEFVDLLAFDAEFGRTLMKQVTDKQKKRPVEAVTKQLRRCLKIDEKTDEKKTEKTTKKKKETTRSTSGTVRGGPGNPEPDGFKPPVGRPSRSKKKSKKQRRPSRKYSSSSDDTSSSSSATSSVSTISRTSSARSNVPKRSKTNLPTFTGEDFAVFRTIFLAQAETHQWSSAEKLNYLLNALRGNAKSILTLLDDETVTFKNLWRALESRYGANKSYTDVVESVGIMKRKPNQDLHDFVIDIKRALSKADIDDDERRRLCRQYFVQGLGDRAQRKFIDRKDHEKDDVKTALDLAVKYEQRHAVVQHIEVSHVQEKATETPAPQDTEVNRFYTQQKPSADDRYERLSQENKTLREAMEAFKKQVEEVLQKQQEADKKGDRGRGNRGRNNYRNQRGRWRGHRGYNYQHYEHHPPYYTHQVQAAPPVFQQMYPALQTVQPAPAAVPVASQPVLVQTLPVEAPHDE